MASSVVSDLDIQALIDDELDGDDKQRVLSALRHNPGLKSRYEQLMAQKRLILAAWIQDEQGCLH